MLLRRFTDFILQGRVRAVVVVLLLSFVPVLSSFSILIAALVTLRKNIFEGALVTVATIIPLIFQYEMMPQDQQTSLMLGIVGITIVSNSVVWFFAYLLRRWGQWQGLLEISLVLGVLIVVGLHGYNPAMSAWWEQTLVTYADKALSAGAVATSAGVNLIDIKAEWGVFVKNYAPYATGFVIISVVMNVLLQLLMARWWETALFNPGGLRKELERIRLSRWMGVLFLAVLVLNYFNRSLALDIIPMVCGVFAVAGLSLIHYLVNYFIKGSAASWFWLLLIYLMLIGLFPYSLLVVAVAALMDTGLDFRKKLS